LKMDINFLRNKIDRLDAKILRLIKKRLKLAKQMGKLKDVQGIKVEDKKREEEVYKSLKKNARKLNIDSTFVVKIYEQIIDQSKKAQSKT